MWRGSFALALALCTPLAARAADDPAQRGFDPDPPRPALGLQGGFTVDTAEAQPSGSWRAELELDYVKGLLAIKEGDRKLGNLLDSRLSAHLLAGYQWRFLQVGVGVPVALAQGTDMALLTDLGVTGPLVAPVGSFALGDVRAAARAMLLGTGGGPGAPLLKLRAPFALAAGVELRAPTGDEKSFYGEGPMAIPGVQVSRTWGAFRADGSLGYVVRRQGQYLQLVAHDAWAAGASLTVNLPPVKGVPEWRAVGELDGQLPRGDGLGTARYRAPLEARAGVRARLWKFLAVEVGAGTGLGTEAGYGRESWRVFAGLRWDYAFLDKDGDGVPDDRDRCPDVPGLARLQGCPEGDADGDGIPDGSDKCPDKPGPRKYDGCPDTDGDGIPDDVDKCPDKPGPKEYDGCPDTDGDGIPDNEDKCPDKAGPAQNDGCPAGPPAVEVETSRLNLTDSINFDTGAATIRKDSFKILDEVASVLGSHSEIGKLRIEGHTDNVGGREYNLDLSQRRAQAVVNYLAKKGVPKDRMTARGYGFDKPVATNATALGRAKNRRVEFTILQEEQPEEKKPEPPKAGAPDAGAKAPPDAGAKPAPDAGAKAHPDAGAPHADAGAKSPLAAKPDGGTKSK